MNLAALDRFTYYDTDFDKDTTTFRPLTSKRSDTTASIPISPFVSPRKKEAFKKAVKQAKRSKICEEFRGKISIALRAEFQRRRRRDREHRSE